MVMFLMVLGVVRRHGFADRAPCREDAALFGSGAIRRNIPRVGEKTSAGAGVFPGKQTCCDFFLHT
jgi:hypothetical protein